MVLLRIMKPPFQILLDSSCPHSKKNFPRNTNSDFIIQLPQRLDFQKEWIVCLKSIQLSNEIDTIHNCWGKVGDHPFKFEDGYVTSLSVVIDKLNAECAGKVLFELTSNEDEEMVSIRDNTEYWIDYYYYGEEVPPLQLQLSNNLCHLLGFPMGEDGSNTFLFEQQSGLNTLLFIKVHQSTLYQSSFSANIYSLQPRQFVVCADFVEHSALGGQQVQMLKYFAVPEMEQKNKRFDVDFNINAYVKLNNKNFDRIHIRILSAANGQLLKSNSSSPSLLQLLFINTGFTI